MPCNAATPRNAMRCRSRGMQCSAHAEQSQSKPMLIHCQAAPSPRLARQIVAMQSPCFADLRAAKAFPGYALPPLCKSEPSYAHAETWFAIGMLSTAPAELCLALPPLCLALPPLCIHCRCLALLFLRRACPCFPVPKHLHAMPVRCQARPCLCIAARGVALLCLRRAGRGIALPSPSGAWHCFAGAMLAVLFRCVALQFLSAALLSTSLPSPCCPFPTPRPALPSPDPALLLAALPWPCSARPSNAPALRFRSVLCLCFSAHSYSIPSPSISQPLTAHASHCCAAAQLGLSAPPQRASPPGNAPAEAPGQSGSRS